MRQLLGLKYQTVIFFVLSAAVFFRWLSAQDIVMLLDDAKEYSINGQINPYGLQGASFIWTAWDKFEGADVQKDSIHEICSIVGLEINDDKLEFIKKDGANYLNKYKPINYDVYYKRAMAQKDIRAASGIALEKESQWITLAGYYNSMDAIVAKIEKGQNEIEINYPWGDSVNDFKKKRVASREAGIVAFKRNYQKLTSCLNHFSNQGDPYVYESYKFQSIKRIFGRSMESKSWQDAYVFINPSCYTPNKVVVISPDRHLYLDISGIDFGHCAFETVTDFGDQK